MVFPVSPLEMIRRGKLLTRWELATRTRIQPGRLAQIEKGEAPPPKDRELALISKALALPKRKIAELIRCEASNGTE